MACSITVTPEVIEVGEFATWQIISDLPAADAWWFGPDIRDGSQVAGWYDPFFWQATYQYFTPANYERAVCTFEADGSQISCCGPVFLTVAPAPGPPPPGPEPPPTDTSTPAPPSLPPIPGIGGDLLQWLGARIAELAALIGGIADRITGGIGAELARLVPTTLDVLGGIVAAVSNNTAMFTQNLVPLTDFWTELTSRLLPALEGDGIPGWAPLRDTILPQLANLASGFSAEDRKTAFDILLSPLDSVDLPPDAEAVFGAIPRGTPAIVSFLGGFLAWAAVQPVAAALLAGPIATLMQRSMEFSTPTVPTLQELAVAEKRQITLPEDLEAVGMKLGYPTSWVDMFRGLAERLLETDSLLSLWRRSEIEDVDLENGLRRLGYSDASAAAVAKLALTAPTPDDVIRFLIRDVFDPAAVSEQGLDDDFEAKFSPFWFRQAGVSEDLARFYWRAHWLLPSPTMLYDMLHRRLIDQDQVIAALKRADWAPGWIEALIGISFNPLTRVDIRRMHRVGTLSDDELVPAYLDIGYNQVNAERLRDFTIALNRGEDELEIEPFRASLKSRAVTAYINGTLSADDMSSALLNLGYTDEQIAAFLAEAEFSRSSELAEAVRAAVKRMYVRGLWSGEEAMSELRARGFPDDQIARLFESWSIDRELRELTDAEREARDLTKAEVLESYTARIIDRAGASVMLEEMGYDQGEVAALLALADHRAAKAEATAARETVHQLFVRGRLDRTDASIRLDQLALPPSHRDALLDRWEAERESRAPEFSPAQLEELVRRELITDPEARAELARAGWTTRQIELLLRLWGSRAAEGRRRLEEAQRTRQRDLSTREIQRALVTEIISESDARARLTALGYDDAEVKILVGLSQRDLAARDLLSLVKAASLEPSDAERRLRLLGYTADDAALLVTLAQPKPTP